MRNLMKTELPTSEIPILQDSLLTVVIPTFNRAAAISVNLEYIFSNLSFFRGAKFIVIDNASPDGTNDIVKGFVNNPLIKGTDFLTYYRQDSNKEAYGNIISSARVSSSIFTMFLSDEDNFVLQNFSAFLEFLRLSQDAFICPVCVSWEGQIMRGGLSSDEIQPDQLGSASNYLSGLTYRTTYLREAAILTDLSFSHMEFARLYPQRIIACIIKTILSGRICFCPVPIVYQRIKELPTQATTTSGEAYWNLAPRWTQFKDQREIFSYLFQNATSDMARSFAQKMFAFNESDLYRQLRAGVEAELGYGSVLDSSAVAFLTQKKA